LEEDFGQEDIRPDHIGIAGVPITLGDSEYFVMGDNRNNSSDSRSHVVGNVSREDIIGRAWLRIWPLGDIGFLKHG
jgi:signal peptidase I